VSELIIYLAHLGIRHSLLCRHSEDGVDPGHVGVDLVVQLATLLRQSALVLVRLLQREEQLLEFGAKLLQSELSGHLRKRLC